jgi:hypothetical protein
VENALRPAGLGCLAGCSWRAIADCSGRCTRFRKGRPRPKSHAPRGGARLRVAKKIFSPESRGIRPYSIKRSVGSRADLVKQAVRL